MVIYSLHEEFKEASSCALRSKPINCTCTFFIYNEQVQRRFFMARYIDLTGQKFGRWTVLNITDKRAKNRSIIWHCKC